MKYYIATAITNTAGHNALRDEMTDRGHKLTYDWTSHGSVQSEGRERIADVCMREIFGVVQADVVIVLLPGGRGTHVELGLAIGLRKPVLLVGVPESFEQEGMLCSFYLAPLVKELLIDATDHAWENSVADVAAQLNGCARNTKWVQ